MKKNLALFVVVLAEFSLESCSLDKPVEFGDPCPEMSFIWPDESMGRIRMGDSGTYDKYLIIRMCPPDHPFCLKQRGADIHRGGLDVNGDYEGDVYIPDEWYCSDRRESCPLDSHLVNDDTGMYCERNTAVSCGDKRDTCYYDGVEYAKCSDDGKCLANRCLDETVLADDMCKSKADCCGDYCDSCQKKEAVCLEADSLRNEGCGKECSESGGINCLGVCVNPRTSLRYCGGKELGSGCSGENCITLPGWRNGDCIDGVCQVSECLLGYHLMSENGVSRCVADSVESCGAGKVDCKKQFEHASDFTCQLGLCMITSCEDGYTLYDNTCIQFVAESCGGVECGPKSHCNENTLQCECDAGYTNCNGECYDLKNSKYHCGQCANSICTTDKVHNSTELACVEGQCAVTACKDAYHVEDSRCLHDTCRGDETDCIHSNGIGQVKTCVSDEWSESIPCEKVSCNNDIEKCGECLNGERKCEERKSYTCINGQWQNPLECSDSQICDVYMGCISCGAGKHVYMNTCENDDLANCGAHGNACAPSQICGSGSCISCNTGQHAYNGGCENNDLNNCGAHDKKCDGSVKPGGIAFSCDAAGACKATACVSEYHLYGDGCEKNDLNNCNGHGVKCDASVRPYGTSFNCDDGTCKATVCSGNNHVNNGICELNDIYNCGAYKKGCPGRSNAAATSCSGGQCGYTCNDGYENCDGNWDNGCEVNLSGNHWSSCSKSCISGYADCDGNSGNGCEVNLNANALKTCTTCATGYVACGNSKVVSGSPLCIRDTPYTNPSGYTFELGDMTWCYANCNNSGETQVNPNYTYTQCKPGQWCHKTSRYVYVCE